jgi:hypothetical protein
VGSGKTYAAIRWMASPSNATRNFLYVAPTIELGTQTAGNLRAAMAKAVGPVVRNVHLVNSATVEGKTRVEALRSINAVTGQEGQIEVLTTTTLLDILAGIDKPELWTVILDEAFEPATFDTFGLGADARDGWDYLSEVFEVHPEDGNRITPKDGKKALVAAIADGRFSEVGSKYEGLQRIAAAVCNPARRCELLVTDRVSALINGEPLPAKKSKSKASSKTSEVPSEGVLEYSSYIAPEYFGGFDSVLFLSALFEQTILYHLWVKALGVTFEDHPDFPTDQLKDTHTEQGRFLAVGHLLHRDDNSSMENLGRNVLSGLTGEKQPGQRVLDHVIRTASAYFGEAQFLLQTNVGKGYEEGKSLVPTNAVVIPAYAHGLDKFQHVDNVVALCVTNPNPQRLQWLMNRTGMSASEVTLSFRIHSCYQALGRCSIRAAEPTTNPKTVLVAGSEDARFLLSLFPGSRWLGQVGDLPNMRATAARTARANKPEREDGKTVLVSKAILEYLGTQPAIDRISSRSLKEVTNLQTGTLNLKDPDCSFPMSDRTWASAVNLACLPGTGWTKQGSSLVRTTAAHYGF